ncbi:MAG: copper amine oxidase N-terminal domain-containing protein, partial [Candidatus Ornithomonoglobus sp.]
MNKKIISLLIAGAMLSSASAVFAADTEADPVSAVSAEQTIEDKAPVNQYIGTIKSVDNNIVTVAAEAEDGEYDAAFGVTDSTPVYDINGNEIDEIKEGDKVIVLSTAGLLTKDIKPVSALIINNEDVPGSVYYDTFSKSEMGFISSDGELVLNIEDELEDEYDGKTLLVFYNIMTLSIPAQTNPTQIVVLDNEEEVPAEETENAAQTVNQYSGIVESYEKNLLTVSINGESVTFAADENTPVYDLQSQEKSEIKEGDAVYVFSTSSLLTKDIKPAKAVVTGAADDIAVSVKLDTFNNSEWGLVSSDNELVINVDDKSEYEGKELLVFYDITTRSIPAQTNPLAVIILDDNEEQEENNKVSIFFMIGDCILNINGQKIEVEKPYIAGEGVTLVPLRVISEAFGAVVDWDGDTKTVSIDC